MPISAASDEIEHMPGTRDERRRTSRRTTWSRATVLWLDGEDSYTLRGHIRDLSADGCSLVSLTPVASQIGAIGSPELGLMSRFQVTHSRRNGLLQVTGMRFLASLPQE
jgi:hypothetical protein